MIKIRLPPPRKMSSMGLEDALLQRRSVRSFINTPLTLDELSLVIWSAGGAVEKSGNKRTTPSAGATYPLNYYCFIGENSVVGSSEILAGIYKYIWEEHSLYLLKKGDYRKQLALASLGQEFISVAPVSLVIAANYARTTSRYGDRGYRYVHFEVGHSGQNLYLIATALGLGTVAVGAFRDEQVKKLLETEDSPLYIFPIGRAKNLVMRRFEDLAGRFSSEVKT
jgi:SagB-type dehydrogenase family enzyme